MLLAASLPLPAEAEEDVEELAADEDASPPATAAATSSRIGGKIRGRELDRWRRKACLKEEKKGSN